jgi:hypothetical protein
VPADTAVAHPRALAALKLAHTAIWAVVEICVVYLLYTGVRGRSGRGPAVAGADRPCRRREHHADGEGHRSAHLVADGFASA